MKLSSTLKLAIVLGTTLGVVGFAQPTYAATDTDGDSVPNSVENSSPNNGDNNYDTNKDKKEDYVATIQNPNDTETPNAWVSLEIGNPRDNEGYTTTPWQITEFSAVDPATLPTQPDGKVFPLGLFNIELECNTDNYRVAIDISDNGSRSCSYVYYDCGCQYEGVVDQSPVPNAIAENNITPLDNISEENCEPVYYYSSVDLRLIFDRVLDTSNWTLLKYIESTGEYIDYSSNVSISTETIGYPRTVIAWTLTDNGFGDDNPAINEITDPAGPAVPQTVAVSNPIVTTASVVRPTALANTGANGIVIIAAGIIFIAAGAVLLPRKN